MPVGRKKESTFRTCEACGCSFYKPASHLAKWPARTCSRKCAAVFRDKRVDRNCLHCNKPFRPRASWVAKGFGLYCSNTCNGLAFQQRESVECRWCSKPIPVTPYTIKTRKKHFCSLDCRIAWDRRFGTRKGVNAFSSEQKQAWLANKCNRCGSTERLELDHIKPRFAGGTAVQENAQTLCRKCNREKFWLEDLLTYSADLRFGQ